MTALSSADAALLASELPPLRQVRLPGGRIVEYREAGPADAPVILLLHGDGSSSAGYRAQPADLLDSFMVALNAPARRRWAMRAWAPNSGTRSASAGPRRALAAPEAA